MTTKTKVKTTKNTEKTSEKTTEKIETRGRPRKFEDALSSKLYLRLSEQTAQAFQEIARKEHRSVASQLQKVITEYVANYEM